MRCTVSGSVGLQMPPSAFLPVLVVLRREILLSLLYYIKVELGRDGLQNARRSDIVRCQALFRQLPFRLEFLPNTEFSTP